MKWLLLLSCALWLSPGFTAEVKHGAYLGARASEKPAWFKESFLEFEQDVTEAAAEGRRLMLYFYQDGCPYCARLVEENFSDPSIETYVRRHFDGIAINMWGDREVVSVAGESFTEKGFAAALKIQFTPTLLFLNEQGKPVLRVNGYYPPDRFMGALSYVAEKREQQTSFSQYMLNRNRSPEGSTTQNDRDYFNPESDLAALLKRSQRPLALYFETAGCEACAELHQKVLSDAATRALVMRMDNVRIDPNSAAEITTPDGETLTQRQFAESLNIGYLPGIVLFNRNGQEVHRLEGQFKTFHVQSSLAYVLEQAYNDEPSFQRYIAARGEKIRALGYAVDIDGYRSFHPPGLKLD